jgi:hypothetical protein
MKEMQRNELNENWPRITVFIFGTRKYWIVDKVADDRRAPRGTKNKTRKKKHFIKTKNEIQRVGR